MSFTHKTTVIAAKALLLLAIGGVGGASELLLAQTPRSAPPNPEFVVFRNAHASARAAVAADAGHHFGLVPLPMDLSYLRAQVQPRGSSGGSPNFASSYDLRSLGRVSPVRNQNPYNTCWSFATYGSLESCLLPGESWSFSEDNLVNRSGFDWGFDQGGNATMSIAYLVRWDGPVNGIDDLYPNLGGSPGGLTVCKHVQQVRLLPPKAGPTLNDEIKQVLMDSGGIDVTYYHNDNYYSPTFHSYYYPGMSAVNHSATLVGWDDNFDRTKFVFLPPGNGAYIVKNSWGTSWGENGFFYVSYYDAQFANSAMFAYLNAEPVNNYTRQYSYDPLGWVSELGVGSSMFWGANLFTAVDSENLSAVGFYALSINTSYTLEIHTDVSTTAPRGGTLALSQSGTCSYPGYRTITLNSPVPLTPGQTFSIVLQLTTPGYNYPQAYEYADWGYSSQASAASGQSYYSLDGLSWTDLTTFEPTANFCIKGYTAPARLSISRNGSSVTLTWPSGVLQEADSVLGPFSDMTGATSPYTTPATGPRKYYRVR